jgi:hypothetical protein
MVRLLQALAGTSLWIVAECASCDRRDTSDRLSDALAVKEQTRKEAGLRNGVASHKNVFFGHRYAEGWPGGIPPQLSCLPDESGPVNGPILIS